MRDSWTVDKTCITYCSYKMGNYFTNTNTTID